MEIIQKGKFLDKIRIKDGLILEVHKYERIGFSSSNFRFKKDVFKRIEPDVIQCKISVTDSWDNKTYPEGTYFKNQYPIKEVEPDSYTYEIRTAGGIICGNKNAVLDNLDVIIETIKEY